MCGIVGVIGKASMFHVIEGLKLLEYRGYDSAGFAFCENDKSETEIFKRCGKIREIVLQNPQLTSKDSMLAFGHTRWATHGAANQENAHPHKVGRITLVHNGIFENYQYFKKNLSKKSYSFKSETDTEILAGLIDYELSQGKSLEEINTILQKEIRGSFALVFYDEYNPGILYGTKKAAPLAVGKSANLEFPFFSIASDEMALSGTCDLFYHLEDGDLVQLDQKDGIKLIGKNQEPELQPITIASKLAEKGEYKHFMLKEIYEQPRSTMDLIRSRYDFAKKSLRKNFFEKKPDRILILACGTSHHAATFGEYFLEEQLGVPVSAELASEFQYKSLPDLSDSLVIVLSQSGETADSIAAVKLAKKSGAKTHSIVNVPSSFLARFCDSSSEIFAGPEIGVASTKCFTNQVLSLFLLGLDFNSGLGLGAYNFLYGLPEYLNKTLELCLTPAQKVAKFLAKFKSCFYLARGRYFPIAMEGALKLKEVTYIHAESYPSAEMKHGPIALIDENFPTILLCPGDSLREKNLSTLREIRARLGPVIVLTDIEDQAIFQDACHIIHYPKGEFGYGIFACTLITQLIAYYCADYLGKDVDQPRNLAKSVTVE